MDVQPCSVWRMVLLGQLWMDVTLRHARGVPPWLGVRAAQGGRPW